MFNKILISVLSCFLLGGIIAQTPVTTIPSFSFSRLDKTAFTNKDLATGKQVFFVFFDTECDHCLHAIQYLDQHYQDFRKAAIYMITLDDAGKLGRYIEKHAPGLKLRKNISFLQDVNSEFIAKFQPRKYPSLFLFSKKRTLLRYGDDEQHLPLFTRLMQIVE
ncbi:MAG: redoxin domain-containing protein [Bacteroidota bacterium]